MIPRVLIFIPATPYHQVSNIRRISEVQRADTLSSCFSYTDEAFGLLLLVNYEDRWRSQHEAEQVLPGGTSKKRSQWWEDARYTSATEGARRGSSWPQEGLVKFNELSAMMKSQREAAMETEGDTNMVEKELMDWCRTEGGLNAMAPSYRWK